MIFANETSLIESHHGRRDLGVGRHAMLDRGRATTGVVRPIETSATPGR